MSRWDISDPDRAHNSELRVPPDDSRKKPNSASSLAGREGTSESFPKAVERSERPTGDRATGPREHRTQYQDRGRTYSLRTSELKAMSDIGRFRTVDVQDLRRFVYRGDEARLRRDIDNLRRQGLVEEKTVFRAHKAARKMVTLTEEGQRIVRKARGVRKEQRIYHGFVKLKEIDHDADLYKVYQKAVEEIEKKGGKPLRVRLDFELKESINREKQAAARFPEEERARRLKAVAEEHGLTTNGKAIHLPDIQIEYETRDGKVERENLELLSQNYREQGIRGKAAAGFKIYARGGETARIRRALGDTGLAREVLSV